MLKIKKGLITIYYCVYYLHELGINNLTFSSPIHSSFLYLLIVRPSDFTWLDLEVKLTIPKSVTVTVFNVVMEKVFCL